MPCEKFTMLLHSSIAKNNRIIQIRQFSQSFYNQQKEVGHLYTYQRTILTRVYKKMRSIPFKININNKYLMDLLIRHKRHKIVKIISPKERIYCLKIFTFGGQQKQQKLQIYKQHFQQVRDWMKRVSSSKSILSTLRILQIDEKNSNTQGVVYMKVKTQHTIFSTLSQYYELLQLRATKDKLKDDIGSYLYFMEELLELILRGGSINNYFYSPNNIFINKMRTLAQDKKDRQDLLLLFPNCTSTVGIDLLFLKGTILKEDIQEIFSLLPTNLKTLANNLSSSQYYKQVNRIIKMKAFVFNILSFIVRYTPNILIESQLDPEVTYERVIALLNQHQRNQSMKSLIQSCKIQIQKASQITGINFTKLFKNVLIDNCNNINWQQIYDILFVYNKHAQRNKEEHQAQNKKSHTDQSSQSRSTKIINGFWQSQDKQTKNFYLSRGIPKASIVYFLVRTNISFHRMMRHLNLIRYLKESPFSSEKLKLQLQFMKNSYKDNAEELNQLQEILIPYVPRPQRQYVTMDERQFIPHGLTRRILIRQGVQININNDMFNTANGLFNRLWR